MPKLNQLNAVVEGVKKRTAEQLGDIYKSIQKADLFYGHTRVYTPMRADDPSSPEGEPLPSDGKGIQADGPGLLKAFRESQAALLDVVYARDVGNTIAKADVKVGDVTLFAGAPVPFLLWLEHRLDDLYTEVKKLPILDPSEEWTYNSAQGAWNTKPQEQARTRKVQRPLVLHEGTKEHPPQVKEITEDIRVGTYRTIKYSTAFQATDRDAMLRRIEKVMHAVKFARESANETNVPKEAGAGAALYDFLFTTPK
jgi:hypothetical protein